MRHLRRAACSLLIIPALAAPAAAVPGATDRVPAASLLVPFLETGINSGTHPNDTLLVVTNWRTDSRTFHYHVWDIDGNPTALNGNITLGSLDTWDVAMRDLLNATSPAVRSQLTAGPFYRGFMTIDAVTAATALDPTEAEFPFSDANVFEGFIYYTRLSQGSANGLAMVALEALSPATDTLLRGFYGGGDNREEIDPTGRRCAERLSTGGGCGSGIDGPLARVHQRIFRSTPLNGSSRGILFTWVPGLVGGPSIYCDVPANGCSTTMTFRQYDQAGNVVQNETTRLDHVVNVLENAAIDGNESGWVSVFDIPNVQLDLQVYGFSFNAANPVANPSLTWDAIFEAFIVPDDEI